VSAFGHASAEAGHDILYKMLDGEPTEHERGILSAIDGIVHAFDIFLGQLHQLVIKRTSESFGNSNEFGTFLQIADPVLAKDFDNDSELLYDFLRVHGKDNPSFLRQALDELGVLRQANEKREDSSKVQEILSTYPFTAKKCRITVCLIDHILSYAKGDARLAEQNSASAIQSDNDIGPEAIKMSHKIHILGGAFAYVYELLGKDKRQVFKDINNIPNPLQRDGVLEMLNHGIASLVERGRSIDLETLKRDGTDSAANNTWDWFESYEENSLHGLAFRIAKMGVLVNKALSVRKELWTE
jgi:hypothetical protein